MTGYHSTSIQLVMKSFALLETNKTLVVTKKQNFGCRSWKRLGPKCVEAMRQLKWVLPKRLSTTLMELLARISLWIKLRRESSNPSCGSFFKRLTEKDML